ncbi:MAG: hypothetical protein WDM85_14060 [Caulobacteraceae bacterium]
MRGAADARQLQERVHQIVAVATARHVLVDDQLADDIGRVRFAGGHLLGHHPGPDPGAMHPLAGAGAVGAGVGEGAVCAFVPGVVGRRGLEAGAELQRAGRCAALEVADRLLGGPAQRRIAQLFGILGGMRPRPVDLVQHGVSEAVADRLRKRQGRRRQGQAGHSQTSREPTHHAAPPTYAGAWPVDSMAVCWRRDVSKRRGAAGWSGRP